MDGNSDNKPNSQDAVDSIVLEEEIDPNYVPSEPEVVEYAKWMGMDLDKDQDLFWIAREGLMAPLPKDWKPCRTKDTEDIYYFNFSTGDSTWDHPCDGYYKRLYEEEKKKKETVIKVGCIVSNVCALSFWLCGLVTAELMLWQTDFVISFSV